MAIPHIKKIAYKALSDTELDLQSSRNLLALKGIHPMNRQSFNYKIKYNDHFIPVRVYSPSATENALELQVQNHIPVIIFIHGGGWVSETIDTYDLVCKNMARETGYIVVSLGYRLAPENPFPAGFDDCYHAVKQIVTGNTVIQADEADTVLCGDSAGGNLCAAISLKARDTGDFSIHRQILIYPVVYCDYSENSPYKSVLEVGSDYVLTRKKMSGYVNMYKQSDEDIQNPYFSPSRADNLKNQPDTLIITASLDPLRDEGEDYGLKLMNSGNNVTVFRIQDVIHGFFILSTKTKPVRDCYTLINQFLNNEVCYVKEQEKRLANS